MIILIRIGNEKDFDPSKMRPGEFAVMLDTKKVFATFTAGDVKQLATIEDMKSLLNATNEQFAALQELLKQLESGGAASILADLAQAKKDIETLKSDVQGALGVI